MKILFIIGSLAWLVFTGLSYSYGEEGLDMRSYTGAATLTNYALISWGVCLISLILSIVGLARIKKKGSKFFSIFSMLLTLFTAFWIGVMISSAGTDLDEIYYGLIGIGIVQALFLFILSGMIVKKAKL